MKLLLYILLIILVAILQISLLPKIMIAGAMPNLLLLAIVILMLSRKEKEALCWVGLGGIILDLYSPVRFGIYTFSFVVIYCLIYLLYRRILAEPTIPLIALIFFFASMVADLPFLFINSSYQIYFGTALYNLILGLIFYHVNTNRINNANNPALGKNGTAPI